MGRLSFFYKPSSVYRISMKALEKRHYLVKEVNAEDGTIKAVSKAGLLKPQVQIDIKITRLSDQQTVLDIQSSVKRSWLTPQGYENQAEEKFVRTLFRFFEKMPGE